MPDCSPAIFDHKGLLLPVLAKVIDCLNLADSVYFSASMYLEFKALFSIYAYCSFNLDFRSNGLIVALILSTRSDSVYGS